jgi:hypothetical protein
MLAAIGTEIDLMFTAPAIFHTQTDMPTSAACGQRSIPIGIEVDLIFTAPAVFSFF